MFGPDGKMVRSRAGRFVNSWWTYWWHICCVHKNQILNWFKIVIKWVIATTLDDSSFQDKKNEIQNRKREFFNSINGWRKARCKYFKKGLIKFLENFQKNFWEEKNGYVIFGFSIFLWFLRIFMMFEMLRFYVKYFID